MLPEVQTLIDAGLRPTHVARLLDVNRATVGDWYKGGLPHRWIIDKVRDLSKAVSIGLEAGSLPVVADQLTVAETSAKTFFVARRCYRTYLGEEDDANT